MHKISVIIIAYNAEPYLERCFSNLEKQTYDNYELLIVDNGSTDNTGEICRQYQNKNKKTVILRNKTNIGVGDGRNTALKWVKTYSDSQYVFFLDVDDWIHPRCLELMVDSITNDFSDIVFEKHKVSSTYSENFECITDYKHDIFEDVESFWCDEKDIYAFITGRLIRKELFNGIYFPKNGLDDERTTFKLVYKSSRVSLINQSLYFWYNNPNSYMHKIWTPDKVRDQIESVRDPLDYFYDNHFYKSFNEYKSRYFELLFSKRKEYWHEKQYDTVFHEQYSFISKMNSRFPNLQEREYLKEYKKTISSYFIVCIEEVMERTYSKIRSNGLLYGYIYSITRAVLFLIQWTSFLRELGEYS